MAYPAKQVLIDAIALLKCGLPEKALHVLQPMAEVTCDPRNGRPYYYGQQIVSAVLFLETGRTRQALLVIQDTLDCLNGKENRFDDDTYIRPTVACSRR